MAQPQNITISGYTDSGHSHIAVAAYAAVAFVAVAFVVVAFGHFASIALLGFECVLPRPSTSELVEFQVDLIRNICRISSHQQESVRIPHRIPCLPAPMNGL